MPIFLGTTNILSLKFILNLADPFYFVVPIDQFIYLLIYFILAFYYPI